MGNFIRRRAGCCGLGVVLLKLGRPVGVGFWGSEMVSLLRSIRRRLLLAKAVPVGFKQLLRVNIKLTHDMVKCKPIDLYHLL